MIPVPLQDTLERDLAASTSGKGFWGRRPGAEMSHTVSASSDVALLTGLHYDAEQGWTPLPEWGGFFISLGATVASSHHKQRCLIALSLPTRAFAAALVALGVVVTKAQVPNPDGFLDRHFDGLCKLPVGTPVKILTPGRETAQKGLFAGPEVINGEDYVCIQVQNTKSGGLTRKFRRGDTHHWIERFEEEMGALPSNPKMQHVVSRHSFISPLLGGISTYDFISHTHLECIILGQENRLRFEILDVPFGVASPAGGMVEGRLNDVLKVHRFSGVEQSYRTEVIHAKRPVLRRMASEQTPPVVVFDGASGYLNWHHVFRDSHWIVLLDRADRDFESGIQEINGRYYDAILRDGLGDNIPVPDGIEMLSIGRT